MPTALETASVLILTLKTRLKMEMNQTRKVGRTKFHPSSEDERNLGTITKTEFLIGVPLNRRGEWDLKYWYDLRLANSQNRLS
jgi:hypothetical protein